MTPMPQTSKAAGKAAGERKAEGKADASLFEVKGYKRLEIDLRDLRAAVEGADDLHLLGLPSIG